MSRAMSRRWRPSTASRSCRSSRSWRVTAAASAGAQHPRRRLRLWPRDPAPGRARRAGGRRRARQERRLHRRRGAPGRGGRSRHRLPGRRCHRPALAGGELRLRPRRAAAHLSRPLGGRGARDAPGRATRRRARLDRARLLDETINLPDRPAVRRALAHETDTAVVESWLPGALLGLLRDLGLSDIEVATRVVIFPQDLGATYFAGVGRHAAEAGALSADELAAWLAGIAGLHAQGSAVRNGRLLPVHGAGVRRGDVVDARAAPRVAAEDAAERQPAAAEAPCISSASSA